MRGIPLRAWRTPPPPPDKCRLSHFLSLNSTHLYLSHLISSHLLSSPLISSHLLSSPLISSHLNPSYLTSVHFPDPTWAPKPDQNRVQIGILFHINLKSPQVLHNPIFTILCGPRRTSDRVQNPSKIDPKSIENLIRKVIQKKIHLGSDFRSDFGRQDGSKTGSRGRQDGQDGQ